MRVFVDASAWVPMEVVRDQWSGRVRVLLSELRRERRLDLVTTNWTMYEALALARRRAAVVSQRLYVSISERALVSTVSEEDEQEALRRFLSWTDQGASVVDHANTVVAVRLRCDAILSFDRDFIPLGAAAGMQVLR